jgi:hypothetical protein
LQCKKCNPDKKQKSKLLPANILQKRYLKCLSKFSFKNYTKKMIPASEIALTSGSFCLSLDGPLGRGLYSASPPVPD